MSSRVQDREAKLAVWIGLPAFFCLVFLHGRFMGRTFDGNDLDYLLFRAGGIAGLAMGVWRTLLVIKAARRPDEVSDQPNRSNWRLRHQVGFVFIYVVIGTIFVRSTGALLNRLIPSGHTKVERALVSRMPSSGGKHASFSLELQMPGRHETQRVPVSSSEYRTFRMLDIVEVHTRRGILGYDYVTDIVKVGSQRIGN